MLEKLSVSLLIFLNSTSISLDPKLVNEKATITKIEKEIRDYRRRIEWIEVTDEDFASQHVKIEKIKKKIENLDKQIVKIKKVSELKTKWAKEDSLSSHIK
jgi:5-bromo-4-chloroindolyl phosphate hydrolysis protein